MDTLKLLREEIDALDKEMLRLFEARMAVSGRVGDYKAKNNIPILNAAREQQVLDGVAERLLDKSLAPYARDFYESVMRISRRYQADRTKTVKTLSYLGAAGSFSHEAARTYADALGAADAIGFDTMEEVFRAVLNGQADYAVIPFENSTTGPVTDVYDLVLKYDLYIVGELFLPVHQHLLAAEGAKISDITKVYSHPQALMQCREFLNTLHAQKIPYHNTAMSAKFVAESGKRDIAAVAGMGAAAAYGLTVLAANINSNLTNITKFIVMGKAEEISDTADKTSVVVSIDHKAGELFRILEIFAKHHVNLLKIESRPDKQMPFSYLFFIDFAGNVWTDGPGKDALLELRAHVNRLKFLGCYKGAEK